MWKEFLHTTTEWILKHLSPRYLYMVAILAGFMLFLPHSVLVSLGLGDLVKTYRPFVVIVLFCSVFLSVWDAADWVWKQGRRSRRVKQYLETLTKVPVSRDL